MNLDPEQVGAVGRPPPPEPHPLGSQTQFPPGLVLLKLPKQPLIEQLPQEPQPGGATGGAATGGGLHAQDELEVEPQLPTSVVTQFLLQLQPLGLEFWQMVFVAFAVPQELQHTDPKDGPQLH